MLRIWVIFQPRCLGRIQHRRQSSGSTASASPLSRVGDQVVEIAQRISRPDAFRQHGALRYVLSPATYRETRARAIMAPMKHSFLFEPAVWSGTGTLWRADGEPLEAHARTEIAHRPECWLLSGTLKVLGSPPTEFVQAYLIEAPRAPGRELEVDLRERHVRQDPGPLRRDRLLDPGGVRLRGLRLLRLGALRPDRHRTATARSACSCSRTSWCTPGRCCTSAPAGHAAG